MESHQATSGFKPSVVALVVFAWLVLFVVSLFMDRTVSSWVHENRIDHAVRGKWFSEAAKFPGTFWFAIIVAIALSVFQLVTIREMLFLVMASVSSASNSAVKWIVGRTRPYKLLDPSLVQPAPFQLRPFRGGMRGLFDQKDLSFVSGHACTAIALSVAIVLLRPKWWPVCVLVALLVSVERVSENAHYFSDVVGAVGLGAGGTLVVWHFGKRGIYPGPVTTVGQLQSMNNS